MKVCTLFLLRACTNRSHANVLLTLGLDKTTPLFSTKNQVKASPGMSSKTPL